MIECDQLSDERLRLICRGDSELPRRKENIYRKKFGLAPLPDSDDDSITVVHDGKADIPIPAHRPRIEGVGRPATGDCKGCGNKPERKPKPIPPSGPGAELSAAMKAMGLPPCQDCDELAAQMNEWGPQGCRERFEEIVDDIMPRAIDWVAKDRPWVSKMFPVVKDIEIRRRVKSYVKAAIDTAERKQTLRERVFRRRGDSVVTALPVNWQASPSPIAKIVTAIRTAYRKTETLTATIDSMRSAGFQQPLIFAEPNTPENVTADVRFAGQQKPFKSFVKMCEWLLECTPDQWFLLCEDDVEFTLGAADLIRTYATGSLDVLSLYVSQAQQKQAGFSAISGDLHGSLAYLIHRDMIRSVLESPTFTTWTKDDRVDRAFSHAVQEVGGQLIVHAPSLAQHTGLTSTLNPARNLTRSRTSMVAEAHQPPAVTLITPTGDRPESFALCERWISQQRYTGEIQWIVVDDGKSPTQCNHNQTVLRLSPMEPKPGPYGTHSLCRNLHAAIDHIKNDLILIIEDDEYYSADYVSAMAGLLSRADMVGEFGAKYYYLPQRRWRHNVDAEHHASLCRTGFTRKLLTLLCKVTKNTNHPSVDLRLWEQWTGSKLSWTDPHHELMMGVGIKGLPGRASYGHRPSANSVADPDLTQLKKWVGADADHYKEF